MTLANMNVHLNRLIGSSLQRLTASVHGVCASNELLWTMVFCVVLLISFADRCVVRV